MFAWMRNTSDDSDAVETMSPSPMSLTERLRMGRRPRSLVDMLPWMDFDPETQFFMLEDGVSLAALYELIPTATEGRSESFLAGQGKAMQAALVGAFPEEQRGEWICQLFTQDDEDIGSAVDLLADYIDPEIRRTQLTQDYLVRMRTHVMNLSRQEGAFVDTEVSNNVFRAKLRRTRAVIYRRYPNGYDFAADGLSAAEQLQNACERFEGAITQAGIAVLRRDGKHFHEWMATWFNPATAAAGKGKLEETFPYPDASEDKPYGWDFSEMLFLSMPRSDDDKGLWYFEDVPHQALTFQALRQPPKTGHLTAERQFNDGRHYALFDKLPEGAILSVTIVIRAQDKVREHVDRIKRSSTGDMAEAELAKDNAKRVTIRMARGDKLYPMDIKLYLRGKDEDDLRRKANAANAVLLPSGFQFINRQQDVLAIDAYIRGLPMAFDAQFDLRQTKRARLTFSSHIASLLPLYGRSRGSGRPAFWFWNRGGEPLLFDPLNRYERKKNAHMVVLGPTGAGKSSLLNLLGWGVMAVHRPRLFIADAGDSFVLLGEFLRSQGLSVHQVTLNPDVDMSLPPFADAYKYLDQQKRRELTVLDEDMDDDKGLENTDVDSDKSDKDEKRDILGEMEIAARIMITGGDPREDDKLTRADRFIIRRAIVMAAQTARDAGRPMMLTENVADALEAIGKDPEFAGARRTRFAEMADSMRLFCSGLAGHFFNRPGQGWPDADVTILEMGVLAREGYEDQLTIAYISFISYINALAEANQHQRRPTVVLTDEAHIVTRNPMLSPYVVKISKMWRKLGVWLWLATQNLGDFPDSAKRMLNMMEWWLLLTMPKEEVDQLARFRQFSDETRNMLLSARKQQGSYAEGVLLSDTMESIFRNVPPSLVLALSQTEKEEKAERGALMKQHGITELEAAFMIAEQIDRKRFAS